MGEEAARTEPLLDEHGLTVRFQAVAVRWPGPRSVGLQSVPSRPFEE